MILTFYPMNQGFYYLTALIKPKETYLNYKQQQTQPNAQENNLSQTLLYLTVFKIFKENKLNKLQSF